MSCHPPNPPVVFCRYWCEVTALPPSDPAVHRRVTEPSPGVAPRFVGASGAVAGGVSFVTGWSEKAAAGLLASSWSGLVMGTVYDTVTVSPARTAEARVRRTFVSPSTETTVTAREAPSTVTVNADGAGSEPASRFSS